MWFLSPTVAGPTEDQLLYDRSIYATMNNLLLYKPQKWKKVWTNESANGLQNQDSLKSSKSYVTVNKSNSLQPQNL